MKLKKLISKGKFVSDEIVNNLLRQSIKNLKFRDRIIFDGIQEMFIKLKI